MSSLDDYEVWQLDVSVFSERIQEASETQLRELCKLRRLETTGDKSVLRKRLVAAKAAEKPRPGSMAAVTARASAAAHAVPLAPPGASAGGSASKSSASPMKPCLKRSAKGTPNSSEAAPKSLAVAEPLPQMPAMPAFVATSDVRAAGQNPVIEPASASVSAAVVSEEEIAAAQAALAGKADRMDDSSDVSGEESVDLKAVAKLPKKSNRRTKKLSKKIDDLHADVSDRVKVAVAEAVDPIKDNLADVKVKVETAETNVSDLSVRMDSMEAHMKQLMSGDKSPGGASGRWFAVADERARRQVAFKEFPKRIQPEDRIVKIQNYMKEYHPEKRAVHIGHVYDKDRNITRHAIAEFIALQAAKAIISAGKPFKVENSEVKVKPALSGTDISRNWTLAAAEQLIREDPKLGGRKVDVKRAQGRGVYVAGSAAFLQQNRRDPRGTFENEFTHLKLP